MNINAFIANWNGKYLDYDKAYGYQCMDLMNQWVAGPNGYAMPGNPLGAPTAYKSWLKSTPKFLSINNTIKAIPKPGDVIYWKPNTRYTGWAGHVAIVVSAGQLSFTSFDQNYPTGHPCSLVKHNYIGVVGWKRKK